MPEQRAHPRAQVSVPLLFTVKGQSRERDGVAKNVGLGGMYIETTSAAAFGADITVRVRLPGSDQMLRLPAVVRRVEATGMGVQFGLLGALETHLITEITRPVASTG
jgi:PilZ domain